jgi:hypothetical protein
VVCGHRRMGGRWVVRTFFLIPFFAVAAFILASLVLPAAGPLAPLKVEWCGVKWVSGVKWRA